MSTLKNCQSLRLAQLSRHEPAEFHDRCAAALNQGARLSATLVLPLSEQGSDGARRLIAVLADDGASKLHVVSTDVPTGGSFPSLTASAPQAQAFERELFETHGLRPHGHPHLKPLRRHPDLARQSPAGRDGSAHPFFRVEGGAIHEVAVGPVHAGIIEPGHFRFQCYGENVLSLEIHLGYQHRGLLAQLLAAPAPRRMALVESVAGDTSIGHGLAYCMALEALTGIEPPLAAQVIRGIALELERLANHVGDLGALANDVGYLPASSYFGRLRGEFLNLLVGLSGNRCGRGLLVPGGVRFGLTREQRQDFLARLVTVGAHVRETAELMLDAPSVLSRFESTGALTREVADELGLVGPAARACGCTRDVRSDHPSGIFRFAHIPVAQSDSGDVLARALVRWIEVQRSLQFVTEQLKELPDGPLTAVVPPLPADAMTVALVEGWRGEIAHVVATGAAGELAGYQIVDPSFHNWFGLAMALRGNQISDFPLCNKSFNLSYAGHDL